MIELILASLIVALIIVTKRVLEKYTLQDVKPTKQYIALKETKIDSIYPGGPPVYFGPFNSIQQLQYWANQSNLTVKIVELKSPDRWETLSYKDRW